MGANEPMSPGVVIRMPIVEPPEGLSRYQLSNPQNDVRLSIIFI